MSQQDSAGTKRLGTVLVVSLLRRRRAQDLQVFFGSRISLYYTSQQVDIDLRGKKSIKAIEDAVDDAVERKSPVCAPWFCPCLVDT